MPEEVPTGLGQLEAGSSKEMLAKFGDVEQRASKAGYPSFHFGDSH